MIKSKWNSFEGFCDYGSIGTIRYVDDGYYFYPFRTITRGSNKSSMGPFRTKMRAYNAMIKFQNDVGDFIEILADTRGVII